MHHRKENQGRKAFWKRLIAFVLVAIFALQPLATGQSVFATGEGGTLSVPDAEAKLVEAKAALDTATAAETTAQENLTAASQTAADAEADAAAKETEAAVKATDLETAKAAVTAAQADVDALALDEAATEEAKTAADATLADAQAAQAEAEAASQEVNTAAEAARAIADAANTVVTTATEAVTTAQEAVATANAAVEAAEQALADAKAAAEESTQTPDEDVTPAPGPMYGPAAPSNGGLTPTYTDGCGHFAIKMPTVGGPYTIDLTLTRTDTALSLAETVAVMGTSQTDVKLSPDTGYWTKLTGAIDSVEAGDTVTMCNVNAAGGATFIAFAIKNADGATVFSSSAQGVNAGQTTDVDATDLSATGPYAGCGHYELVMPEATDDNVNSVYKVILSISGKTDEVAKSLSGTAKEFDVVIGEDTNGINFEAGTNGNVVATILDLQAGDKILLKNILASGYWDSWAPGLTEVNVEAEITSSDNGEKITYNPQASQTIVEGETVTVTVTSTGANPDAWNPFRMLGEEGSLLYLLNNYNVVSKNDIVATHIVGPIIAQRSAYRNDDTNMDFHELSTTNFLAASDYSRGLPSYVGVPVAWKENASFMQMNYRYDYQHDVFVEAERPNFYMRETVLPGTAGNIARFDGPCFKVNSEVYPGAEKTIFPSPNGSCAADATFGNTFQNNAYIDFGALYDQLLEDSKALLTSGSIEGNTNVSPETITIEEGQTQLTITGGKSYFIKNAKNLERINIDMPGDYGFLGNHCPIPTVVSFEDEEINPVAIPSSVKDLFPDDTMISQLPATYINGQPVVGGLNTGQEFDEQGNKIIWNLPYVTGPIAPNMKHPGIEIAGHIVAPQAEFWNMASNGKMDGGNLHGTGIFEDFHSGIMESHLFTYDGSYQIGVDVELEAEKILTGGNLTAGQFKFELTAENDELPAGVVVEGNFPFIVSNDKNGNVKFPAMTFNPELTVGGTKTYTFQVSEVNDGQAGITYDTAVYTVTIVIEKVTGKDSFGRDYETYQVKSQTYTKNGTDSLDKILFANSTEGTTPVSVTAQVEAQKNLVDGEGTSLEMTDDAFQFELVDGDGDVVETVGNAADGKVTFSALTFTEEGTYVYTMKEVIPAEADETISYDATTYTVTIVVSKDGDTLKAVVSYETLPEDATVPVFTNTKTVITDTFGYSFTKQDNENQSLKDAVFAIGTTVPGENWEYTTTVTSGEDGVVSFTELAPGAYYFKELTAPEGFQVITGYWELVIDEEGNSTVTSHDEAPTMDATTPVVVNQPLEAVVASVKFHKQDQYGIALEGAEFSVVQVESLENRDTLVADGYTTTVNSVAGGTVTVANLPVGVYKMTETVAPENCFLPADNNYWLIEVVEDTENPGTAKTTVYRVKNGGAYEAMTLSSENYIIVNFSSVALPGTGGPGTAWFMLIGLLLLSTAGLLFKKVRKTHN